MAPKPKIRILDGGLGTTLSLPPYSCVFSDDTPLWSSSLLIDDPDKLQRVQTAFVQAGAEVLLTATYQSSFEGFAAQGVGEEREVGRLLRSAVGIAEDALKGGTGQGQTILGLGAYGAVMRPSQEYTGKYDAERATKGGLRKWHEERVKVFEGDAETWGKVDGLAFETVPLLVEIAALREVMFAVNEGKAAKKGFWISCVFPGEGEALPDGSEISDVVRTMLEKKNGAARPHGIGINCTKVGKLENLILSFEREVLAMIDRGELDESERPALVTYPDGTAVGETYNTTTKEWEIKALAEGEDSRLWDEIVGSIVKGVWDRAVWSEVFVGGCCKTGPEEIRKLRDRVDQFR